MIAFYNWPIYNAIALVAWVLANAALSSASWRVARRLYPGESVIGLSLHAVVIGWASVNVVATAVGAAGILTGWSVLVGVSALAIVLLTCLPASSDAFHVSANGQGAEPLWAVGLWMSVAALLLGHVVAGGLLTFVSDYDSLMYHIPLIDQWLHSRSLFAPYGSHWSNPGGNELLGLWMVGPFTGNFLIALTNLPATVLLVLAVLELGRVAGLGRPLAHATALSLVGSFPVVRQLLDAGNDISVAAMFISALFYGLRSLGQPRPADRALCAVCVGLLCGIKYFALGYAAVAAGLCLLAIALVDGRRSATRAAATMATGVLLFGGYWYLRNAVARGSPCYLPGVTTGLASQSHGAWNPIRSSFLGSGRPEVLALGIQAVWKMAGPYPALTVVASPAVVLWLLLAGARKLSTPPADTASITRLALALATLGAIAVLLITPFAIEDRPFSLNHLRWGYTPVRYGLSYLCLALIGASVTVQTAGGAVPLWHSRHDGATLARDETIPPVRRNVVTLAGVATALIMALAAIQLTLSISRIDTSWVETAAISANILATWGILFACWQAWPRAKKTLIVVFAVFATSGAGLFVVLEAGRWNHSFFRFYEIKYGTRVLSALLVEPTPSRLCLLDYRCAPFFGPARQFRVCQPEWFSSSEAFAAYLRERRVSHVIVRTNPIGDPAIWDAYANPPAWFSVDLAHFTLVSQDPIFSLYRVDRTAQAHR
jgi:hypothetical protein